MNIRYPIYEGVYRILTLEQLFSSGSTRLIKGFKGKKGVAFDASVTFDAGFTLTLSFPKNGNGRKRK